MSTEVVEPTPAVEPKKEFTQEEMQKIVHDEFTADDGWKCIHLFGRCWRVNQWVKDGWLSKMVKSHFVTVLEDGIRLD